MDQILQADDPMFTWGGAEGSACEQEVQKDTRTGTPPEPPMGEITAGFRAGA